jgi:osmoprotectant transport system permease protein
LRTLAAVLGLAVACGAGAADPVKVGSKRFTESYILGEVLAQAAGGIHKPGLGNTAILYEALKNGAVDVYPEYTGTIAREILHTEEELDLAALNRRLRPLGLAASTPLGFDNSYALGTRLRIKTISGLARHPEARIGLSHEFLGRRDGWPGLSKAYGLPQVPRGLDHGLAYEALATGEVDVIDVYSTDAKIERYQIRVLEDDRGFFPSYAAVLLHAVEAPARFPAAFAAFRDIRIDARTMVQLNARAEIDKIPFAQVASEYLGKSTAASGRTLWTAIFAPDFGRLLAEHLGLVFGSLGVAALIGVPLGILASGCRLLAQPVLVMTGLIQTIPSLALLAVLIPLTGAIGVWPAMIALFLYALLPITRNTHVGLSEVPQGLVQAGAACGLTAPQVLAYFWPM